MQRTARDDTGPATSTRRDRRRGHRRWVAAVVAAASAAWIAVALSAAPASATRSSARPAPSPGCSAPGSTGTQTLTPTVGGRTRTVIVHTPPTYTGHTPVALVLNLHGSGSTAHAQELFTGMDATADANGFLVAYPQGAIKAGTGFDWNVPNQPLIGGAAVPKGSANDVSFVASLITYLSARYCVDPHRVYSTGFSGGARMTSQLACDLPNRVAAVAPVSGLRLPSPCPGTRAVPVLSFHGTADPVDPYLGNGQRYWTYSVPTAAQRWAAKDSCSSTPTVTNPSPTVQLTAYTGCAAGTTVELYTISGAGHTWPGGPPLPRSATRLLGPQSNAIDASSTIWSFFAAHPRP